MERKTIEFHPEWDYAGSGKTNLPKKRTLAGNTLAKRLKVDSRQYRERLKMPNLSFVPNTLPVVSTEIVRPEELFSKRYTIEVPDRLKVKHDTLCNSGDVLHEEQYDAYYIFLGKLNEDNIMIDISGSGRCRIIGNEKRGSMERIFSYEDV